MPGSVQLIVGLGNPGQQYQQTRHNAGAEFVAALVNSKRAEFKADKKFFGLHSKLRLGDSDCHCLIPTTQTQLAVQALVCLVLFS